MASPAIESKTCQCVCERNEAGECVCVCTVPCAFDAENKTVEWTCDCKCGDSSCRCRFQIKCNRKPGDGCCGGGETCERNIFTCKCKCAGGECTVQISKCKCCEVTRIDCGGESEGSVGCCSDKAKKVEGDGEKGCCGGKTEAGSGCCAEKAEAEGEGAKACCGGKSESGGCH